MNKALFLDRDGTLIYDKNYLCDPDLVEVIPGVNEALRKALDMGYMLFLFTNQSGIGRDYFSAEDVHKVNDRMEELIGLPRPLFADICIAPERPDERPVYRKPSPKFILEMVKEHDLDPKQCYMVGDTAIDVLSAHNAGITPIAVATGKGEHPAQISEVAEHNAQIFESLRDFVDQLQ